MNTKPFSTTDLIKLAGMIKILCEPNRLLLLEKIIEGIQCNCELGQALQIPPNLISHHLSVLRKAGLIVAERDAVDNRWVYYSINPDRMDDLKTLFVEFFDKDRIQPRGAACGPHITEEQRQSLLRMTKK
jgi:ArsR family transcriptional regulator